MSVQKYVLITGASNGIGLCFAEIYAQRGFPLLLIARSEEKLKEIQEKFNKKYGVSILIFVQDLAEVNAAKIVYEEVKRLQISINTLINNAGFGDYGLFEKMDLQTAQRMMQLNMVCLTELCHYFVKDMLKARSGAILNIASNAAFQPGPWMSLYFATKAFVLNLTEGLHEELKPSGISVTALCPGPTETGFVKASRLESSQFFKKNLSEPYTAAMVGYQALKQNKAVAIVGWKNKLQIAALRITPRFLVRKITKYLLGRKA